MLTKDEGYIRQPGKNPTATESKGVGPRVVHYIYDVRPVQKIAHSAPFEFAQKAHTTRMSGDTLESVPGLTRTKHAVSLLVVLTINSALGKPIFEACNSSVQDVSFAINRTVEAVRRETFASTEDFDGDVSTTRQRESVTSLLWLVGLILEGEKADVELSPAVERMVTNIAQIIRFHAVFQASGQLVRYPSGRNSFESLHRQLVEDLAAEGPLGQLQTSQCA